MLIGQSILAENPGPSVYYSPWMPRESDAATFVAQLLLNSGGAFALSILVQHKNTEDPDSSATTAATFSSITANGTSSVHATGLKELVRYKYSATGTSAHQWIHCRMNPPIWQPN